MAIVNRSSFAAVAAMCWTYQHAYNGANEALDYRTGEGVTLKHAGSGVWHEEYLARLMMFCALRYRRPEFLSYNFV